jgi:hypothetical protein
MNSLDELRTDMKNIAIPISINFQENYRLIVLKIYIKKNTFVILNHTFLEPDVQKLGHGTVLLSLQVNY